MKIGLINFELAPAGLKQLLEGIIKRRLLNQYTVTGIYINQYNKTIQYHPYDEKSIVDYHHCLLQTSPLIENENLLNQAFEQFDAIVVIGSNESIKVVSKVAKQANNKQFLFIPVSIHNDIEGADTSLGYDTAMNNIIENVLKIKDTVYSLKYEKPRLFGIQIPGRAPGRMLEDLSLALEGYVLQKDFNGNYDKQIEESIKKLFANGKTYSFLIFDETIQSESISGSIIPNLIIDWKVNKIDQSLCTGSYPTATDRILAMKLAVQVTTWINNRQETGELLVQGQKIILREMV